MLASRSYGQLLGNLSFVDWRILEMSEQKTFESGFAELIKKAFTVEITHCYEIVNLENPYEGLKDTILVENQLGQSFLVDTSDPAEAIKQFHLYNTQQIENMDIKLLYSKIRLDEHAYSVCEDTYCYVNPTLCGALPDRKSFFPKKFLPVPLVNVSEPAEDGNPHKHILDLPIKQNRLLSVFPLKTDTNFPEPTLFISSVESKPMPCVCLVVEHAPEGSALPNTVSLVAKSIRDIGCFPVIYGGAPFSYDDNCSEKDTEEQIKDWVENYAEEENYFVCRYRGWDGPGAETINRLLKLEHIDFVISDGCATEGNLIDWSRLDKSLEIWLDGQLSGYRRRDDEERQINEDNPW